MTLSNFWDAGVGFELRNQIRHCKTVCIKSTLYLINYNHIRSQWPTKGNRDAGFSCSCGRGLHRYLWNFGGVWTPQTPPRYATDHGYNICNSNDVNAMFLLNTYLRFFYSSFPLKRVTNRNKNDNNNWIVLGIKRHKWEL